jgi:trans-aconitate methyltransferase
VSSAGPPANPHAQEWDPAQYAANARFVSDLGEPLLDLLAPRAGERILDLGCGDGALTEKLVAAGCEVVGIDGSPGQVAAARARGLDARVENAESRPISTEFDALFSKAVLHWLRDQPSLLPKGRRALRPGGRFVAELGGVNCVQTIRHALHAAVMRRGIDPQPLDPWFFPTAEEYRTLLERAGFAIEQLMLFPRPTPLPGDVTQWLETFARPFLGALAPADRDAFLAEVREETRPVLFEEGRGWTADYVRLRFRASLPRSRPAIR